MLLDRVTITGADDSIDPKDLVQISKDFPFVEWGILFSKNNLGTARYPSKTWQQSLCEVLRKDKLNLSAHLCGRWVRDFVLEGHFSFVLDQHRLLWSFFKRIQLNFHAHHHPANKNFINALTARPADKEYIFQLDGVNDMLFKSTLDTLKTYPKPPSVVPLFDTSGGAGILPNRWPSPIGDVYNGYAGGLGPDNLEEQIKTIEKAAGNSRIWIDMETRVRSDDDRQFDLEKVKTCLKIAQPFVSLS